MRTILVIEDNTELCGVVCTALENRGFRVTAAYTVAAGLELALNHLPDLIISDVNMGNGDGGQLKTALWKDDRTAAIPFILMTGDSTWPGFQSGMQSGAQNTLVKPFRLQTLFDTVDAALRKKDWIAVLSRKSEPRMNPGSGPARQDI